MEISELVLESPSTATARRRKCPRYTLRSLAYVKLNETNGGIVRDLSESGIAVQAVAPLRPDQLLTLEFDLLSPRIRVEGQGAFAGRIPMVRVAFSSAGCLGRPAAR